MLAFPQCLFFLRLVVLSCSWCSSFTGRKRLFIPLCFVFFFFLPLRFTCGQFCVVSYRLFQLCSFFIGLKMWCLTFFYSAHCEILCSLIPKARFLFFFLFSYSVVCFLGLVISLTWWVNTDELLIPMEYPCQSSGPLLLQPCLHFFIACTMSLFFLASPIMLDL